MNVYQNENDNALFRQSLLTSPGERQDVEYKASISFAANSEFDLKLVKHILGMANIGGGWIVIGHEDGTLQPDPNHSDDVTDTYDTTLLSAAVNKVIEHGQTVRLVVHKELNPRTRLTYPVIRVQGFERTPFICRSTKPDNKKPVLQEGKVYIRRPGAETTEIQTSEDWDELLKRCVSQRRGEFLSEFADMARRMIAGDATPTPDAKAALENWMDRRKAASSMLQSLPDGNGYIEFAQMLVRPDGVEWRLVDLRRAAESARLPYVGWRDGLVVTQEGIEFNGELPAWVPGSYLPKHWHIGKDGKFYASMLFSEDGSSNPTRVLYVDEAINRITGMVRKGTALYEALQIRPTDPYLLCVRHSGLADRSSSNLSDLYLHESHVARVEFHNLDQEVTLDSVKGGEIELISKIANSLFELFGFLNFSDNLIDRTVQQTKQRMGSFD